MSAKKQPLKILSSQKDVSFEYVQKWKTVVYSWSTQVTSSYKASTYLDKSTTFSVKTVQHCCDLEIKSRSLKVVWMGKA